MVLAEPVLVDGRVLGAVVTISPTDELRPAELQVWWMLAAAAARTGGRRARRATHRALGDAPGAPPRRGHRSGGRRGAGRGAAGPVADGSGPPELRRLSESFDRMAETVTHAYAAQRAFVDDASHQLRNPLTALRLRLSNLEDFVDADGSPEHIAALEEAERLSTLLDGLLALARAERTLPRTVLDVDADVEDRVEAWRLLAEHTGLRLVRDGARGLKAVASARANEIVLDAVLDNAIKFSPPGGAITVCTTATPERGRDRGAGQRPRVGVGGAGAGHGPLLAQPGPEQRRGLRAGAGHRRPHGGAGRRPAAPGAAGGRRVAGGRDAAPASVDPPTVPT